MNQPSSVGFITLHDDQDGSDIVVRFGRITSMQWIDHLRGREFTLIRFCDQSMADICVREPIATIFDLMNENTIAVHGSDYGLKE